MEYDFQENIKNSKKTKLRNKKILQENRKNKKEEIRKVQKKLKNTKSQKIETFLIKQKELRTKLSKWKKYKVFPRKMTYFRQNRKISVNWKYSKKTEKRERMKNQTKLQKCDNWKKIQ